MDEPLPRRAKRNANAQFTFAIGAAGAANAGLFAVALLANHDARLARKLAAFRKRQVAKVKAMKLPK